MLLGLFLFGGWEERVHFKLGAGFAYHARTLPSGTIQVWFLSLPSCSRFMFAPKLNYTRQSRFLLFRTFSATMRVGKLQTARSLRRTRRRYGGGYFVLA